MQQIQRISQRALSGRVTVIVILLMMLSACNLVNKRGAATREKVVNTYLYALEEKDERAIISLISRDYQAEQAVQAKVAQLGGRKLSDVQVCYQEVVGPQNVNVTIQGFYNKSLGAASGRVKFKDTLIVQNGGDRWYLILGKYTGEPSSPTGPTTRPVTIPSK